MKRPRVAVVIAVWGGTPSERAFPGLAPAIPALFGEPCESIAVFNGTSQAQSAAESLGLDRWAVLSENAGVARGWNIGWQLSMAEIVCFLNEDVRAKPESLRPLLKALDADPGIGAVGPGGALWDMKRMSHGAFIDAIEGSTTPCDAISGFALAVRREALRAAGGFDERFGPAGSEEIDFCLALRVAGWRLGVVACRGVEHEWGISAESQMRRVDWIGGREALVDINARSRALLRAKWSGVDIGAGDDQAQAATMRWSRLDRTRARLPYLMRAGWAKIVRHWPMGRGTG